MTKHDFYDASTSKVLGEFSEKIAQNICGQHINTKDKNQYIHQSGRILTSRDLKIAIAEKCIVPILTRKAFMLGFSAAIEKGQQNVVYECFNQEELDCFFDLYEGYFDEYLVIQLRRETEQPQADKRELFHINLVPTYILHNNYAPDDLHDELDRIVF